jgi:hypothetical protein
MKSKYLLPLLVSIILILAMVATGCTSSSQPAATQTARNLATTVTGTTSIRAMNPQGVFIPVETKPLAPRLDTIDGKTLYVCQGEADPVIMPALYKALVPKYPKTKFIYYDRSDFGPNVPGTGGTSSSLNQVEDPDILTKVQGVIRGIGW